MNNLFSSLSDHDIWQQFKSGSEEAYSFIYETYVPVLYSYGYRIYPDEEVVKDCLQDLFVTLWLSRQNLGGTFEDQLIELEELHLQSKDLDTALSYLSDRQREAIFLRFYQNINFEEIASIMGITPRAVYKLIYRAVDILRKNYTAKPSSASALPTISWITLAILLQLAFLR